MRQLKIGAPWTEEARAFAARRAIMRQLEIGDPRAEAALIRAEELLAEARAFAARRAILRGAPRPSRARWAWAASGLLTIGRRLLRPVARLRASVSSHETRGVEP